MRFSLALLAATASLVIGSPVLQGGFDDISSALDPRDPALISVGTSPGCGADCPVCGDESCVCGNAKSADIRPCCNGYESTGENLPNCVATPS